MNYKKQLLIAYLNTFTFSCVQIILYTTIPYISEVTKISAATIIGSISVGSLIFAFMGPFWASRSDTLGRKRVISLGMFGMGLSILIICSLFWFNDYYSMSVKLVLIYLSRIIYGLLVSAVVPVSQAWQLDLIDTKDKMRVLTRNSMCLNIGRILGPVLILFKQVNLEHLIYFFVVWIFVLALSCFLTSSPKAQIAKKEVNEKKIKATYLQWKGLIKEALLPILLSLIFTGFVGILHSTLGHHLKITLGIRGDQASVLMAKIVLGLSASALLIQLISQWKFKRDWKVRLLIGAAGLVSGSFMLNSANTLNLIWSAILLISFGIALIPPVYLALISTSSVDNVTGKKIGLASISHSLGYALGTGLIALSMKLNYVSTTVVYIFISSLALLVIFGLLKKNADFVMPEKVKHEE